MTDNQEKPVFSRRQFLRGTAAVGAGIGMFALVGCQPAAPAAPAAESG